MKGEKCNAMNDNPALSFIISSSSAVGGLGVDVLSFGKSKKLLR